MTVPDVGSLAGTFSFTRMGRMVVELCVLANGAEDVRCRASTPATCDVGCVVRAGTFERPTLVVGRRAAIIGSWKQSERTHSNTPTVIFWQRKYSHTCFFSNQSVVKEFHDGPVTSRTTVPVCVSDERYW